MPYKDREKQRWFQRNWMQERRRRALQYLGGECAECGATKNLEIDHIDHTEKKFHVNALLGHRWETVIVELAKCQALCHSCHVQKNREERSAVRGEQHPRAKLTEDKVREIRHLRSGGQAYQKIADRFGVSRNTIGRIIRKERWAHVL